MHVSHSLEALFYSTRGEGAMPTATSALESALRSMIAAGRAAWPRAAISDEDYVLHVARRCQGDAASDVGRIHAADLFLACACAAGDAAAIEALERQFLAPLPALVARRGIALHDAEEVVQALRERLLVGKDGRRPAIVDYDGRGAIGAWVRVAAIRSASNLRRDEQNRKALAGDAAVELPVGDPALAIIKRRFAAEFQSALVEAFAALDPTDRTVLRLQFKDGLNLDAIARVLGLSRATAGRRLLAARQRVREEVMKRLGQRTSATPAELESILGLVQSALDVSLGALDVP